MGSVETAPREHNATLTAARGPCNTRGLLFCQGASHVLHVEGKGGAGRGGGRAAAADRSLLLPRLPLLHSALAQGNARLDQLTACVLLALRRLAFARAR